MEQARWGQFVDSTKALCYYVVGNSGLGGEVMGLPQALMYLSKEEKAQVREAREKLGMSESQLLKALTMPTIRKIARMDDPKALRKMKAALLMRLDGGDEED